MFPLRCSVDRCVVRIKLNTQSTWIEIVWDFIFVSDYVIMHSWVICLPVLLSNTLNWLFFIYFIGQNMRVETSVTVSCNFEFFNGNWIEIVSKMPTWILISKILADFQQSISCFLFPTWRICSQLGCNCQKCLFLGNLSHLMLVYNISFFVSGLVTM